MKTSWLLSIYSIIYSGCCVCKSTDRYTYSKDFITYTHDTLEHEEHSPHLGGDGEFPTETHHKVSKEGEQNNKEEEKAEAKPFWMIDWDYPQIRELVEGLNGKDFSSGLDFIMSMQSPEAQDRFSYFKHAFVTMRENFPKSLDKNARNKIYQAYSKCDTAMLESLLKPNGATETVPTLEDKSLFWFLEKTGFPSYDEISEMDFNIYMNYFISPVLQLAYVDSEDFLAIADQFFDNLSKEVDRLDSQPEFQKKVVYIAQCAVDMLNDYLPACYMVETYAKRLLHDIDLGSVSIKPSEDMINSVDIQINDKGRKDEDVVLAQSEYARNFPIAHYASDKNMRHEPPSVGKSSDATRTASDEVLTNDASVESFYSQDEPFDDGKDVGETYAHSDDDISVSESQDSSGPIGKSSLKPKIHKSVSSKIASASEKQPAIKSKPEGALEVDSIDEVARKLVLRHTLKLLQDTIHGVEVFVKLMVRFVHQEETQLKITPTAPFQAVVEPTTGKLEYKIAKSGAFSAVISLSLFVSTLFLI